MIFQLALGGQMWYIVGCYLVPDDAQTIEGVVVAVSQNPQGTTLLVVGDFYMNLAAPEGRA